MEITSNGFESKRGNKTPKAWATMIIWKINVIKKNIVPTKNTDC